MGKKTIFLDIDGTLMDFQGRFPESAGKALSLAKAAGHRLVLCSGRTKSEIYPELLGMNFDGIIASAGAYVECGGEVIYRYVIGQRQLQQMLRFFKERHVVYCLQTGEGVIMTAQNRIGFRDYFLSRGLSEETIWKVLSAKVIEEEDSGERENVEKAAYYGAAVTIDEMKNALGDYFDVQGASYGNNTTSNGEITCAGQTKATGIRRYAAFVGADMKDSIGVGDGLNDIEMLSQTGFAVAMGNAKPATKAAADYITDDVSKDGLWKAFKYLNLI